MSQYGDPRRIGGTLFMPLLDTEPFCTPRRNDKIMRVIAVHAPYDNAPQQPTTEDKATANQMVGRNYSEWLALPTSEAA